MIPLIKPLMPPLEIVNEYLQTPYETGVWSNFGELYRLAESGMKIATNRFPVLVNSATAAIDLAISERCINPSMIAVPDFTHAGSMVGVRNNGACPLIVACEKETMAMDRNIFEDLCRSGEIDAAVIVNPFGYGIDRNLYAGIADRFGVELIFDYAGGWGGYTDFDDDFPTVYSFHATKSMPIGEGGMVTFATADEAERARKRSNFSTGCDRLIEDDLGQNFKMSEVAAAFLCAQIDSRHYQNVLQRIENKAKLYDFYAVELKREKTIVVAPSLCVFPFPEIPPDRFELLASSFGFVAKQYYIPLRTMPGYLDFELEGKFCRELDHCIALPSDCTLEEAAHVVDSVRRFLPD